jgi:hypothetical protein
MTRHCPVMLVVSLLTACGAASSLENGTGSGGAGGAHASGGSSAAGAGTCTLGTVTFQVKPSPGSTTQWCLGRPGSCSSAWLGIRSPSGDLGVSNYCATPCDTCMTVGCPSICLVPPAVPDTGVGDTWNGTYYLSDHCGSAGTACQSPRCAAAGSYTAVVCGFANPAPNVAYGCGTAPSGTPVTCAEQPFQFPTSAPVVVTMPR